nr:hypothetical protein [Tanacetum cinerariifolium]
TITSAVICLATNQRFNFSKYIFDSMVKHLDSENKFLMYPRLVQVFLDKQVDGMSKHNAIYVTPSHTKKVFSNTRRVGKDFSGRDTPLFPTMFIQAQADIVEETIVDEAINEEMYDSLERATTTATSLDAEQDRGNISKTQSKATPNEPSSPRTSSCDGPRRQDTMRDTIAQTRSKNVSNFSNDPYLLRINTLGSKDDRLKLKELIELCTKLSDRVFNLKTTKTSQAKEITNLKKRVKRVERNRKSRSHGLKILYKVGLSARVESSDKESLDEEDASKQGRKIIDIDADKGLTLIDETIEDQRRINDKEIFDTYVLNDEEVVVEDVNVASIATAVTAAATITVSINDITLAQALVEIKTSKPKMKKKAQINLDEELVFKLQAKEDEKERIAEEKAQLIEDENLA